MKSIYNNYNFQSNHCEKGKLITSNIDGLLHSSKLINSSNDLFFHAETAWGYNFPLVESNLNINFAWRDWSSFCKKNNIIAELVKLPPFINFDKKFLSIFEEVHLVSKTCSLELKDESFLKEFNKKTRYIIRKSQDKFLYKKAEYSDLSSIKNLYYKSMINLNAKKRFFLNIKTFEYLIKNQNCKIYLAYSDKTLISFVCFLFDENISHYHLSASNKLGRDLNANYFLLYKAIEESYEKGIKLIHYGGGLTNDENDNLFRFKLKFSNKILDYKIGLSIHNKDLFYKIRNNKSAKIIDYL
tara:strand:+ start:31 stop:927 length:897 start_codon:yes stop_codon:yes gene_type:complete